MVIGGFSYQNGDFKFTSRTANHKNDGQCPTEQQNGIRTAVRNYWFKNQQNTYSR